MGELRTDYKLTDDGMGVTIEALFKGMQGLVQSKTVVGEPIRVDDATIIPLIEVTAGLASGALDNKTAKQKGAGAMSAKLSPVAMLIMQHGTMRLVSVKNQDVFTKLLDLIPDAVDKFTGGSRISRAAEEAAAGLAETAEPVYTDRISEVYDAQAAARLESEAEQASGTPTEAGQSARAGAAAEQNGSVAPCGAGCSLNGTEQNHAE